MVLKYEVRRYEDADAKVWNDFVARSRQGTFLFDRGYMDYHRDRFHDYSLMICHHGQLVALLPADAEDHILWSHQGLTYGGLLTSCHATASEVCDIFQAINHFLVAHDFRKVVYKAIPWIYHRIPSEEDLYALINVCGARIRCRHVSSTLTSQGLKFTESRRSGIRKARHMGVRVGESNDLAAFWHILEDNLMRRYGVRPVHNLSEIQLLRSRFPDNIKLYMSYLDDTPLAGTLIYETAQVVHTQYISASPLGKSCGALDILFDNLLHTVYASVPYFDFGKSSNGDGHDLNRNLIFQKEGFGGRSVCYDWYEYDL